MKKLIIIITGLISLSFAVIVVGVLFLINLDMNNYKDWLSEQFYERTGRDLVISGNIESSIYPWLGFEAEGLSISNPDGFSDADFLVADRIAFRIKLMPLLNQEYEIDTIELSGATLNLEVAANGMDNWSSFADANEQMPAAESGSGEGFTFNQLIIGGVAIESVQVNYIDQLNDQTISANNINMNIPELVYGEPLDLVMSFQLSATNPDLESAINLSSTLSYDLDNNIYALENLSLDFLDSLLEADLRSDNGSVNGSINFSTERTRELFGLLGQAELAERIDDRESGGENGINLSSTVSYNFEDNNYSVEDFNLEFLGSKLEADLRSNAGNVSGSINFNSERPQELFNLLGQDELAERIDDIQVLVYLDGNTDNIQLLPFDLNVSVSGSPLISPTNVHLYTNAEFDIEDENLMLNDFSLSALDLLLEGKFNISNVLSQPDISGEFDIESFNPKALSAALEFELPLTRDPDVLEKIAFSTSLNVNSESLELNRFILELDDTLITGSLNANDFNQPDISFDIALNTIDVDRYLAPEQTPASTSTANNAESTDPSFTSLQSLNLAGEVSIDELRVSGLTLSDVLLGLNANQGLIELAPVQANLYQGSYTGSVSLNVNNEEPQFTMQSTLQNINIEPLSNDFIGASYASGSGTINLALTGNGSNAQSILASLNGTADLALTDGVLEGVDVGAVLAQLETMIRSRQLLTVERGGQTAFDNLSASVQINNGIARSNDLLIQAPGFNVTGIGTLANLQNQSIDFDLLASVNAASASVESEEYDIGGYALPINCSGSMNSPSCLPDINSIVSAAIGNVLQEGLSNVLQEGIGGLLNQVLGTGNKSENAPEDTAETGEPAEESNMEQSDPVEELFNSVLDSLFN
ncbi:MAG: hypothetical protein COA71_05355 [SAR86 cluster bacterium]|uniref:AsmA domain-containing protein n=1 Tax=SAR86 cluster bacterium TaxID=2030880 RepID=A0A2A5CGP0_9GAMM|nr:MAG: hypothetical protein COA71_05355 [SAR86 cluster bacterium]